MYVLDTNVVSELRRRKPHGGVQQWMESVPNSSLHIAAVTAGEIQAGVEVTRKQDPRRAEEIEFWLDDLVLGIKVLDANTSIFRLWAKLMFRQPDHLIEDALIAATALHHDMVVVTRNVRDFMPFSVRILNPFDHLP